MDFHYQQNYQGPILDAYEKALLDCIQGDHMLLWRQDDLELCWEFYDPVLKLCENCEDPTARLNFYKADTWGPEKAAKIMRQSVQEKSD